MTAAARAFGLAVGIALIAGLAACATAPSPAADKLDMSSIDLNDYVSVTARLDFESGTVVLPVDAIDHLGPDFMSAQRSATHALVDACLVERGLPPYEWSPPPEYQMDNRLYGSWSVSFASRFGFADSSRSGASAPAELTDEQKECFGSADVTIRPALDGIDTLDIDTQIRSTAYDAVRASPQGKAALESAQRCMTDEGLTLDPTSGYPSGDDSAADSESNIRIAVIIATCNVETGAIQTLFDLTARYQQALMDANEAAVTALQDKNADRIAELEAIAERAG